jgi:hypothetical protein
MQAFHQRNILIDEEQVNDINPLYELAHKSRGHLRIPQLSLIPNRATDTQTRVSPANFDTIHFVFKLLLLRYLAQGFIADLTIYAATPPPN